MKKLLQSFGITGLCFDSRKAKIGDVFFAIKGESFDGNKFIKELLNRGIKLIITDDIKSVAINPERIVHVDNARIALGLAASILFPKVPKFMVAATGTNGKTSVTSYCRQLYSLLGKQSCNIGTLGIEYSTNIDLTTISKILDEAPSLTTTDPISFRKILDNLAKNNIDYLAFEASSHGLHQDRLHGIKLQAACFTSFSQDHLDYHQNMDDYLLAKLKLFTDNLLPTGIAVISSEIEQLDFIKNYLEKHGRKFITVGKQGDIKINKTESSIYGQTVNFTFKGKDYNFSTEIIGSFQASNLLIAAMLVNKTGFDFEEIIAKLPKIKAVRGRLERVTSIDYPFHIFVDYAHTPDALENTLSELRKIKFNNNRLKVIFGCGGNRDSNKRALMGQIAAKLADEIIVTDDNPRNENPRQIRQQIIEGILNEYGKYIEVADRGKAIATTITNLQKHDTLLIAGKGHEDYQIIGDKKIPFSDVKVVKEALMTSSDATV